ncbi:DUF31 family putative serine protease [Malacoplasma iowae]|uniref:Putative peptidase, DUF31 superfamily n=1 Tax=Malacoplasma iowae DK-CPA TaxID=1394179 RepID=A0A084U4L4_MALIO|nr:hypothetical protein [Malacoplasma iowae]KFB07900.1 putative peptidase, DUF31 superfamily [Malacoplasma iowae DK-CPA]WPL38132.1 hypothetical protein QX182_01225 [Malacoplasma iowae]WPL41418.1 hypothetical protein QX184_02320 [Malacoplasma iowae]
MSKKLLSFLSGALALFAIGSVIAYFVVTSVDQTTKISQNQITDYQKLDDPETYQRGYRADDQHLKWISERSFSLRFLASKYTYKLDGSRVRESYFITGTAWIVQKDMNSENTYYLATNMHVSSVAANDSKQYIKSELLGSTNWISKNGTDYSLNGLDVGIIGEKDSDGNYSPGTIKSTQTEDVKLRYVENKNNLGSVTPSLKYSSTDSADFSIVYSAFETFNNFKDIVDNQKLRGTYVLNPTADFSVLKVNFSKILNNPSLYFYSNELKIMLQNYDAHPTKFTNTFNPNDTFYVGGFPTAVYNNPQKSATRWSGLSNVKVNGLDLGEKTPVFTSQVPQLPENQKQNRLENEIEYSGLGTDGKEYYSHRNVAVQGTMNYVNLLGGSSGSMVINSKNEVVGIYWGGLQYSSSNKLLFEGRFDFINVDDALLKTNTTVSFWNKTSGWKHYYNLKDDLNKKINGKSLV